MREVLGSIPGTALYYVAAGYGLDAKNAFAIDAALVLVFASRHDIN